MRRERPAGATGTTPTIVSMTRVRERVLNQAIAWVVRLSSGEADDVDQDALFAWMDRSSAHRAAFDEAVGAWNALGRLSECSEPELRRASIPSNLQMECELPRLLGEPFEPRPAAILHFDLAPAPLFAPTAAESGESWHFMQISAHR